jgi:hypothetical protein
MQRYHAMLEESGEKTGVVLMIGSVEIWIRRTA